ncbi:hypothetical protein BHM03_00028540 [Ensete ventricosum]|nr:hypothetical protein BHM03_00028540 [Ensete ventricosum]
MGGGAFWIQRMCRLERPMGSECGGERHRKHRIGGEAKAEKLKNRSKLKLWMIRTTTTVLLWTCVLQLMALGETWGPRITIFVISKECNTDRYPLVPGGTYGPPTNWYADRPVLVRQQIDMRTAHYRAVPLIGAVSVPLPPEINQ